MIRVVIKLPYVIFKNDINREFLNIITLPTISRCAKHLKISKRTANRRLVNSKRKPSRYKKLDESVDYGIEFFHEKEEYYVKQDLLRNTRK